MVWGLGFLVVQILPGFFHLCTTKQYVTWAYFAFWGYSIVMVFSVSSKLESCEFNTTEIFRLLLLHRSWGVKNRKQGRRIEKTAISLLSSDIVCLWSSSSVTAVLLFSPFFPPLWGPIHLFRIYFPSLSPWYCLKMFSALSTKGKIHVSSFAFMTKDLRNPS